MEHTGFPSPETLAEFIDGSLDAKTRRRVIEHMNACDECYGVFVSTSAWRRDEAPPDAVPRRRPAASNAKYLWMPATAAAVLAVGFFSTPLHERFRDYNDARKSGMADLVKAANELEYRPTQARLNSRFAFRALQATTRGPEDKHHPDARKRRLDDVVSDIEQRAGKHETVATLHAAGVAHLLTGDYDVAVDNFNDALLSDTRCDDRATAIAQSTNADLLIDATAAYLARTPSGPDSIAACESAARAVELRPNDASAVWNHALALERVGLTEQARRHWQRYMTLEPRGASVQEASEYLRDDSTPRAAGSWAQEREKLLAGGDPTSAARFFPAQLRTYAEEDVLSAWWEAVTKKNAANELQFRSRATAIGKALQAVSHDALFADTAAFLDRIASDRALTERVARAHAAFAASREIAKTSGTAAMLQELRRVRAELESAGSPFLPRVDVKIMSAEFSAGAYPEALAAADRLEKSVGDRYPLIEAQLNWVRGLCHVSLGKPDEALAAYDAALRYFTRAGDSGSAAAIQMIRGEVNRFVGSDADAWRDYIEASRATDRFGEAERRPVVLTAAARAALAGRYYRSALAFTGESMRAATITSVPAFICEARVVRSNTLAHMGRIDDARADIVRAENEWQAIRDEAVRHRLRADVDLTRASLAPNASTAAELIGAALTTAQKRQDHFRLARLYLMRGQLQGLGSADREAALRAGIHEIETQRIRVADATTRISYFDTVQNLYSELVKLLIASGRTGEALSVADSSRARVLLDELAGAGATRPNESIAAIAGRMSPDAAIVEYYAAAPDVFVWVVRSGQTRFYALGGVLNGVRAQVRETFAETRLAPSQSEQLFDSVLRPIQKDLRGVKRLLIVPHDTIANVPFAMLRDRATRRYLVEDADVTILPSIQALAVDRPAAASDRVFVVAEPASGAAALPGTQREVDSILRAFPAADVVGRADATPDRFIGEVKEARIVHFAGHAAVNAEAPQYSSLLFAPDATHRGGRLYAYEIASQHWPSTDLVVLAACNTRNGKASSEGSLSLAHAFLTAQVGTVAATLWPVEDRATANLLDRFYESIARGASPSRAMSDAQRAMLSRDRDADPRSWGTFQVYSAKADLLKED